MKKGFTLINLLVIIALVGVLAAIVFVAVNPASRIAQARNARRFNEVTNILNALLQYQVDVPGNQLPNLTPNDIDDDAATIQIIGTTDDSSGCPGLAGACPGITLPFPLTNCFVDLSAADLSTAAGNQTILGAYLSSFPMDPLDGTTANTRYYVNNQPGGQTTIGACNVELGSAISVAR